MTRQIYLNLPVLNVAASRQFFTALGFSFHPHFCDEQTVCLIIGDNIYAMLLEEARFRDFTKKPVADARQTTEVLICIDAPNREAVDEMVRKAVAAGGRLYAGPIDHGWMYGHSFEDLDGHQWEIAFMDEAALPQQMQAVAEPLTA